MLNEFKFEGNLVSIIPNSEGDNTFYLKLEGLTPDGYSTVLSVIISESLSKQLERVNKYARVGVRGHIESKSKETSTDRIKRRTYHIVDEIVSVKDSKIDYD